MPADLQSFIVLILLDAFVLVKRLCPYVLGGIILGALAGTFLPKERSYAFLRAGRRWFVLPLAALAGMISPACTYGTVPVFMEAIKRGAPLGPAAAFLVSSSLVNPQMSVLAAGALGTRLAFLQIGVALLASLAVGIMVDKAASRGIGLQSGELLAAMKDGEDGREAERGMRHKHHRKAVSRPAEFGRRFVDMFEFVGFYFLLGTLIAAALPYIIDVGAITALLGQGKWYAVPLGAIASVPMYLCGGGMIPFLSEASQSGMHHGAILAFLIAGPATRITPLAALAVLFRKRYVAAYVAFIVLLAMAVGLMLGRFV